VAKNSKKGGEEEDIKLFLGHFPIKVVNNVGGVEAQNGGPEGL
jgi:hypothetical protein